MAYDRSGARSFADCAQWVRENNRRSRYMIHAAGFNDEVLAYALQNADRERVTVVAEGTMIFVVPA